MNEQIQLTVNGVPAQVKPGIMLLEVLQNLGVEVPTLCNHRSLEPSGACRLCVVEVTHPDWKGWSGLVTSCLYPVASGIEISTISERVRDTRSTLLELYMSRCPDSETIKTLARNEGIDTTTFPTRSEADLCVQCGQCTRVCNELSVGAIAALGRGGDKTVGPNPNKVADDCVGCLACSEVCPTGEIKFEQVDGRMTIWNKNFDIETCKVSAEICRACGACEEACPFDIPRVKAFKSGAFVAFISPEVCTGCGICAGVCPTGAIEQKNHPAAQMTGATLDTSLKGRTVAFACRRSAFSGEKENIIPVSCVGRVSTDNLLNVMARGADGVVLMCRDQETCPYGDGGKQAEQRVELANKLVQQLGLGDGRVSFVHPEKSKTGPDKAYVDFRKSVAASVLDEVYADAPTEGFDEALTILHWLKSRPELTSTPGNTVSELFDKNGEDLIYLGNLPEMDLLLSQWTDSPLVGLLYSAALLLEQKSINARTATKAEVEAADNKRVFVFSKDDKFDRDVEVITLDELAGCSPDENTIDTDVSGSGFMLSGEQRRIFVDKLKSADFYTCASPLVVAQVTMLIKTGSWIEADFVEPTMAFANAIRLNSEEADG